MKRLTDDEILEVWNRGMTTNLYTYQERGRLIAQAQLDSCEQQAEEMVKQLSAIYQKRIADLEDICKGYDDRLKAELKTQLSKVKEEIEKEFKFYHYALIHGSRKSEEYTVSARDTRWSEFWKGKGI